MPVWNVLELPEFRLPCGTREARVSPRAVGGSDRAAWKISSEGHRMGRTRTRAGAGLVVEADALIALDRGEKRMIALLDRAMAQGRIFQF